MPWETKAFFYYAAVCFVFFPLNGIPAESGKIIRRVRYLAIAAAAALIVLFFVSSTFREFLLEKLLRIHNDDDGRMHFRQYACRMIRENGWIEYLFGYGATAVEYEIERDLHNTYLTVFLTGGIT